MMPTPSTIPPMNDPALKPDTLHDAGVTVLGLAVVISLTVVSVPDDDDEDDDDDDDVTGGDDVGASEVVLDVEFNVDVGTAEVLRATHTYNVVQLVFTCTFMLEMT